MSTSYRLVGGFSVDGTHSGFHCPVFVDHANGRWFIQEMDEASNRVEAFREVPNDIALDVDSAPDISVGRGARGIFCILDPENGPAFGNLDDLSDVLKRINTNGDSRLRLQIGDLLGDRATVRTAALEFAHSISQSDPKAADRFLRDAMVPQLIWKWLLQNIDPSADKSELIAYRHRVFVATNVSSPGIIPDELWDSISNLVTISREFLASSLKEMFGPLAAGNSFARRSELMRERQVKLDGLDGLRAEIEQATQRIESHRDGIGSVYRYSGNPPEGSAQYEATQSNIKRAQEQLAGEERAYFKRKQGAEEEIDKLIEAIARLDREMSKLAF